MKCPLCGYEFEMQDAAHGCKGCPMAGACHMARCPNCGYDVPLKPDLSKLLRFWKGSNKRGTARTG